MNRISRRRWVKRVLIVALCVVAALALGLLSCTVPQVRSALMQGAVRFLDESLPGDFEAEAVTWSLPARWDLERVEWRHAGATLLRADRIALELNINALASRDLVVERADVDQLVLDVPSIAAAFEPGRDEPSQSEGEARASGQAPFLREGSVPGLPSLQVVELRVDVPRAVLTPGDTLRAALLRAQVDVRADKLPRVEVTHVEASIESRGFRLLPGTLTADLQHGSVEARLSGQIREDWPFTLVSTASESNRFRVELTFPGQEVGANLEGTWERRGALPVGLEFDSRLRLADMQKLGLDVIRRFSPANVRLRGRIDLDDGVRGHCALDVDVEREWFRRTRAHLRFDATGASADSFEVDLVGLELRGQGAFRGGELQADCSARYDGASWLQAFADSLTLPDSLRLQIAVQAKGTPDALQATLAVNGALPSGAVPIDTLSVLVEVGEGFGAPMRWALALETLEYGGNAQGVVTLPSDSTPMSVSMRPIEVLKLPRRSTFDAPVAESEANARVVYDPATGDASLSRLRVVGDLGEFEANGALNRADGGDFEVVARWLEPPLLSMLSDTLLTQLQDVWPRDSVPQVHVEVHVAGEAQTDHSSADATFVLPGPNRMAFIMPEALDVSGWDDLHGSFHATRADSIFGSIDLGATSWIDTCRAEWSISARRTAIDLLKLSIEGAAFEAKLGLEADRLDGTLSIRADKPPLVQRWTALGDSARVAWDAAVQLSGTRDRPTLDVQLTAGLATSAWLLPELRADAMVQPGRRAEAEVRLPQGMTMNASPFRLDQAHVHYTTESAVDDAHWLAAGALQFDLDGPEFEYRQSASVNLHEGAHVRVDSLKLRVYDRELHNQGSFVVSQEAGMSSFSVRDVRLEGSMGRVRAHCVTSPDTLALDVDAAMDLPVKPPWLQLPEAAWPSQLDLQASGSSHDDVHVAVKLHGTRLSQEADLGLEVDLVPVLDEAPSVEMHGFEAQVALTGVDTLLAASAVLPFRFEQFPLRVTSLDDSVRVRARWQQIPFALQLPQEGLSAFLDSDDPKPHLNGQLRISGHATAPEIELEAGIDLPLEGMTDYDIALTARGNGAERMQVDLNVERGARRIAVGRADLPLRVIFSPFELGMGEGELTAQLRADSLDLAELTPLLPAGSSAKGVFVADFSAEGPVDDPQLRGSFDFVGLELEVSGRRTMNLDFDSQLRGSLNAPDISGTLRVVQARLRIPERENLLPTEAQPLLWESTADSVVESRRFEPASAMPLLPIPEAATVALKIDVPSGFWILGKDLGVELKGDLDAGVEKRVPVVHGRLEAVQGWFALMGRNFELDSGRCDFDGVNAFNPSLNIQMRTKVKSTTIFVSITGDVEEPELELRSEPEMSEGDIMGMLVFGQSADALGSGEGDFLAAQVTALAQSYSGAALQEVLGDRFGVDTVRFKSFAEDGDSSGGTALEVGKYISPSVLLQYEIDLHTGESRGVTMEYRINDRLKLDSHVWHERSGVEFNWSRDY